MALKPWKDLSPSVKRSRKNLYEYLRRELSGDIQIFFFDSFGDSACTEFLASGTVETTGVKEWDYTQVEVLTNTATSMDFVGMKFFVESDAKTDGSQAYQLYTDDGTTGTGMYVKVYEEAPGRSVSLTIKSGDDPVQGAKVVIGGVEKTTGSAGGCSFTGITDGNHTVTVTKTGYEDKTQTIAVAYDSTSFDVSITAEEASS